MHIVTTQTLRAFVVFIRLLLIKNAFLRTGGLGGRVRYYLHFPGAGGEQRKEQASAAERKNCIVKGGREDLQRRAREVKYERQNVQEVETATQSDAQ